MSQSLTWTIPSSDLKNRGYIFQKLYAMNYKSYRKSFGEYKDYTIWLFEKGKEVEIDDLYQNTQNVIEFYKQNRNINDSEYIIGHLHRESGEMKIFDQDEQYTAMFEKKIKEYNKKYKGWRQVIFHKELFDQVVAEIDYITK